MDHRWEQMEGESARAYAVFREYLDIPPTERSLKEVSRRCYPSVASKSPERQHIPGSVAKWSTRFEWLERAAAWDTQIRLESRGRVLEEREDLLRKQLSDLEKNRVRLLEWFDTVDLSRVSTQGLLSLIPQLYRLEREVHAELAQILSEAGLTRQNITPPTYTEPYTDPWLETDDDPPEA